VSLSTRNALVFAAAIGLAACNPIPKPAVMAEADAVSQGTAATEAKALAPAAYAQADKLRRDAQVAWDAGDHAGAQLLSERAIAAYAHATAIARIARAETGGADAAAKLSAAKKELEALDAEVQRESAEAEALELRVKVARDAQPIQPSGRVDPEREKARMAAARALGLEARLLCAAAKLLGSANADEKPLTDAQAEIDKLEPKLAPTATAAPIDEATRARAACLSALTLRRRAATSAEKSPGAGDSLLSELSASASADLSPVRDDRGVVVTMRSAFKGKALAPTGETKLADLGRVLAAHPTFPALVVLHADKAPTDAAAAEQKALVDLAVAALKKAAPNAKVVGQLAGNAAPVVDPAGADRARNARLEIVFVTPEAM
jgi:hypothetical protein